MNITENLQDQPIWVQDLVAWLKKIEAEKLTVEQWVERVQEVLAELPGQGIPKEYWAKAKDSAETAKFVQKEDKAEPLSSLSDEDRARIQQELEVAQNIKDEEDRSEALAAVAAQLSSDQPQLLEKVLEAVQNIKDESYRSPALAAVVRKLLPDQPELLQKALQAAQKMEYASYRSEVLAAVAAQLSSDQPQLLEKVLEAVPNLKDEHSAYYRSKVLVAVSARLPSDPPELLQKALEAALNIESEEYRSKALAAVSARLPSNLPELLQKALEASLNIESEEYRSEVLTAVVRKLPSDPPELLQKALEAALNIESEEYRSKALAAVSARLPPEEQQPVLQKALQTAQDIENRYDRSKALATVATQLPSSQPQLLEKALEAALNIIEYDYWKALPIVAAQLPSDPPELLEKALQAALSIIEKYPEALAVVATKLPSDQRQPFLEQALEAAQDISNEYDRSEALVRVASQLPSDQPALLEKALEAALNIKEEESYRSKVLMAVAAKLSPDPPALLEKTLQVALDMEDDYNCSEALAAVVAKLSPDPPALLAKALEAVLKINEQYRSEALAAVVAKLPSNPPALLEKTLEAVQNIKDEYYRSKALAAVVAKLPPDQPALLEKARKAALDINGKYNRSKVLTAVAAKLPSDRRQPVLKKALEAAQNLEGENNRWHALVGVADQLTPKQPELLNQFIQGALSIQDRQIWIDCLSHIAFQSTECFILQCPQTQISTALETVPKGKTSADKAKLLSALAPRLSIGLFPRVLQIIQNEIKHPTYQSETLGNLLPYLPPEQLPESLAIIKSFAGYSAPAAALCQIIPKLAFPELELVFKDFIGTTKTEARIPQPKLQYQILKCLDIRLKNILEIGTDQLRQDKLAQDINDRLHQIINEHAHLLNKLSSEKQTVAPQSITEQTKILRAIREDINDYNKADALIKLAPKLQKSLFLEAQSIAQEIQNPHHKTRSLVALAAYFPLVRTETQRELENLKKAKNKENKDFFIEHIELLSQFAIAVPEAIPSLLKTLEEWSNRNPFDTETIPTDPERRKYKRTLILKALKPHLPIRLSREITRQINIGKAPQDLWERSLFVLRSEYRQALKSGSFRNDAAQDEDLLSLKDEINALTEMLLMRDLEPPVTVGILGGWGGGKSYIMHLMQRHMVEIRSRGLDPIEAWGLANGYSENPDNSRVSRFVGHVYQIKFDAWTYSKANLWASLMQTIFFELDNQITLEIALKNIGINPLESNDNKVWQVLFATNEEDRQYFLEKTLTPETLKKLKARRKDGEESLTELLWEQYGESEAEAENYLSKTESDLQNVTEQLKNLEQQQETILAQNKPENWVSELLSETTDISLFLLQRYFNENVAKDLQEEITKRLKDNKIDVSNLQKTKVFIDQTITEILDEDQITLPDGRKKYSLSWLAFEKWRKKNQSLINIFLISIATSILFPLLISQIGEKNYIAQLGSLIAPLIPAIGLAEKLFKSNQKWMTQAKQSVKEYQETLKVRSEDKYHNLIDEKNIIELRDIEAKQNKLIAEKDSLIQEVENAKNALPKNRFASMASFVSARVKEATYDAKLGIMHQVKQDLSKLSQSLLPPPNDSKEYKNKLKKLQQVFPRGPARVVLYIDDLDRCPPDTVVEVLEAVQLLVKNPLFIAVLAIDERYINRALAKHYRGVLSLQGRPSAADYLEKIIQIPYRVRPIAEEALRSYLRAQIVVQDSETSGTKFNEFSPQEFNILIECCQETELSPRSLKRLTNVYKLYKILSRTRGQRPTPREQKAILALLIFSSRYPDLMRDILEEIATHYEEGQHLYEQESESETLINVFNNYLERYKERSQNNYLYQDAAKLQHDVNKLLSQDNLKLKEIRAIFDFVRSFSFVGDIGADFGTIASKEKVEKE